MLWYIGIWCSIAINEMWGLGIPEYGGRSIPVGASRGNGRTQDLIRHTPGSGEGRLIHLATGGL